MNLVLERLPTVRPGELAADAAELVQCLGELHAELRELVRLVREKLASLRRADAEALVQCAAEETGRLEAVLRISRRQEAVLARLAQRLRWPEIRSVRLSEIAARLPEPYASQIHAKSLPLRQLAEELQEKGRLAADVARNLQSHVRAIFARLAKANQESVVYARSGREDARVARNWVDAVG